MKPEPEIYMDVVERAISEDIGAGDITTESLCLNGRLGEARIKAKEDGIVAGLTVAGSVFRHLNHGVEFIAAIEDGSRVRVGDLLATVRGEASALLGAERVALNFLQQLSGIATLTFRFVRSVKGTKAIIKDTRKTTPGLRELEKYAVRAGGGVNHRQGLFDEILIKDNHIHLAGGIAEAVRLARRKAPGKRIEIEARTLAEVGEAIDTGADIIMLDNMNLTDIEKAVGMIGARAEIEVSGNINLLNVTHIAMLGVDVISVGALTHSPDALDISMEFVPLNGKE
jgi:nicotinate-nucleotide pyrophosphorylase (carboxylating)